LADADAQSKVRESVKEKKVHKKYDEEFKRQAVELVIHSGRTQAQIARELGVSEYSRRYGRRLTLGHLKRAELGGEQLSPEQKVDKIREQQKVDPLITSARPMWQRIFRP
jgi:transposase-like protein